MSGPPYADRAAAGRALAGLLTSYAGRDDVLVLALPRGGVPVAAPVAESLGAPLDVFVVRKLGVPGQRELAMGAIASGGIRVLNDALVERLGILPAQIDAVAETEAVELARRERDYRGEAPAADLAGKVVILVDDGLATGASMRAAVQAVRTSGPGRIVVAVPVAPVDVCRELTALGADEIVCAAAPADFSAVGAHYRDFRATTDAEVRALLLIHCRF